MPAAPVEHVCHPGPAAPDRIQTLRTGLVPVRGQLQMGETLTDGLHRLFQAAGCRGGLARLEGGACAPFHFVGPAFSTDAEHAAWYSETRTPPGGASIVAASAVVGWRDGQAFVHCHGLWEAEGDLPPMGHMLTSECVVSAPITVTGFGSPTASFECQPDAETNFMLYTPTGTPHPDESAGFGLLLRIRPHEDFSRAIETACAAHGIAHADIIGLGSIIRPDFEDAPRITCPITEVMVEKGVVEQGHAHIRMTAVDVHGTVRTGMLRSGGNPVCVTAELLLVARS
ncbi:MAG: DUF296 domain-containing protein [Xanthobacter sp.]